MATSRAPLGARGEADWRVPSLSLHAPETGSSDSFQGSDAALLFLERAAEVNANLALDRNEDHETIRAICSELDGMPLAIELAAARLRILSLAQITDGLADRFRLLGQGPRTPSSSGGPAGGGCPPRHDDTARAGALPSAPLSRASG